MDSRTLTRILESGSSKRTYSDPGSLISPVIEQVRTRIRTPKQIRFQHWSTLCLTPSRTSLYTYNGSWLQFKTFSLEFEKKIKKKFWNIPQFHNLHNCGIFHGGIFHGGIFHRCVISNTVEYSINKSVEYSIVVQIAQLWNISFFISAFRCFTDAQFA